MFLLFCQICDGYESTVILHLRILSATSLLVLMGLSGFKTRYPRGLRYGQFVAIQASR